MAKRNISVDIARGSLIFYIITIVHGLFWLQLIPVPIAAMLLFEMPIIFIISGYAYRLYQEQSSQNATASLKHYGAYIFSRWSRILLPYFAYAICCIILCVTYGTLKNANWPMQDIALSWLNPFEGGKDFTFSMLNWHLWFIPPFLIVTALLPAASNLTIPFHLPLWMIALIGGLIVFLLPITGELLQYGLFYLVWAVFGYHLAKSHFSVKDYGLTLFAALVSIIGALIIYPDIVTLNMQRNKFPPNSIFYLFSVIWVCAILISIKYIPQTFLLWFSRTIWFKPFIYAGYSIFLWQGLGYTIAYMGGKVVGLPALVTWPIAIITSVILGIIASPIERLRINPLKRSA